jgi:hypothetical protein
MDSTTVDVDGRRITCVATTYDWPHGCGVHIDLLAADAHVGAVRVLCARDQLEFQALSTLAPEALVSLALRRFAAGELQAKPGNTVDRVDGFELIVGFGGPPA